MTTQAERIEALMVEFDRLKERQDHLDRVLQGDPSAWVQIIERLPDHVAEVTLDKPVGEARQGALAMTAIVKTLATLIDEGTAVPDADPLAKLEDEVARKRAAKAQ